MGVFVREVGAEIPGSHSSMCPHTYVSAVRRPENGMIIKFYECISTEIGGGARKFFLFTKGSVLDLDSFNPERLPK